MRLFREIRDILWNIIKSRTFLLSAVFVIFFGILLQRVFYLQIVRGADYQESFSLRTEREVSLASTRGNIYDRNGNVLAYSELSWSVTIEDNGSYPNTRTKNAQLNETIYKLIKLIEKNGDSVVSDLGIVYQNGSYEYSLTGTSLLRLKADVFGKSSTSDLDASEELATADELMEYMCSDERYAIKASYTEEEKEEYGISVDGYTPEEQLQIATIRFGISANSYKRYVATTVATDVSEETVAAVQENQNELQGADVEQSSRRIYTDSIYFAPIIGYIGKASSEELEALQEENPDYELNDIVGKTGIEQYMETELQGTKGYEKMYVDSVGRVLEVTEQQDPEPGNDVYLTIDRDLQIAAYQILEQKLAGILVSKIQNTKEYIQGNDSASEIMIPIYDVYYALIDNYIIDITHFSEDDATDLEKSVYQRFLSKREQAVASIMAELNNENAAAYQNLSQEMKNYMSYIVSDVLMGDNQVLMSDAVDTSDATYTAWTTDEVISLREYLQYAISMNWIDVTKISGDDPYLDSQEIYQLVLEYIQSALMEDMEFGKMLYKYMLLDDQMTGREVCLLLYDQGVLEYDEATVASLQSGSLSAYNFMIDKISNLEITPAQLALEPCSGGVIIVDVNTGDTLACVTYPSYDNNRLTNVMDSEYYNSLRRDLSSPFVNRVTQENLAPGSTFKPIVAIAGMEEGVITPSTVIYGAGQFTEITPSPTCWIFNQYGGHHGNETVVTAIRDSCNYFFYEVGYRLAGGRSLGGYNVEQGLATLEKYARMFGLGDKSGLEIAEYDPQISDEDAVRSSIGQGTNAFSLSHIGRYVAALANRGSVYNLTLLDRVESADGTLIEENEADLYNQVEIADSSWDAVQQGMMLVADDTTSLNALSDLGLDVAGKTGTAQQSRSHPNHALFVGYAPADNPEIAVAVRIANGYTSSNTAEVAADIFKYYFNLVDDEEILTGTASGSSGQNIAD